MKLSIEGRKIILKSTYDPELVLKIKTIPAAAWNKNKKHWEFPMQDSIYSKIRDTLGLTHPELEKNLQSKVKIGLGGFKFKYKPFDHQREGIKFVMNRFGFDWED